MLLYNIVISFQRKNEININDYLVMNRKLKRFGNVNSNLFL
jgi:hypothetical protein